MSDSDSEDDAALKEAIAVDFLPSSLYQEKKSSVRDEIPKPEVKPSARLVYEEKEWHELDTTPEFRCFIAKQLDRMLESSIKEVPVRSQPTHWKQRDKVKLFRASKKSVKTCSDDDKVKQVKLSTIVPETKKKLHAEDDSISEEDRINSAAVTSDWVLSKEPTKYWIQKNKGVSEMKLVSSLSDEDEPECLYKSKSENCECGRKSNGCMHVEEGEENSHRKKKKRKKKVAENEEGGKISADVPVISSKKRRKSKRPDKRQREEMKKQKLNITEEKQED